MSSWERSVEGPVERAMPWFLIPMSRNHQAVAFRQSGSGLRRHWQFRVGETCQISNHGGGRDIGKKPVSLRDNVLNVHSVRQILDREEGKGLLKPSCVKCNVILNIANPLARVCGPELRLVTQPLSFR